LSFGLASATMAITTTTRWVAKSASRFWCSLGSAGLPGGLPLRTSPAAGWLGRRVPCRVPGRLPGWSADFPCDLPHGKSQGSRFFVPPMRVCASALQGASSQSKTLESAVALDERAINRRRISTPPVRRFSRFGIHFRSVLNNRITEFGHSVTLDLVLVAQVTGRARELFEYRAERRGFSSQRSL